MNIRIIGKKLERGQHEGILRESQDLIKDMGKITAGCVYGAKMSLKQLDQLRRILVVVKKK